MTIRRLLTVPAAAVLAVGLLGACDDPAPAQTPAGTMTPEDSMEEDSSDDGTMDEDTTDEDGMDEGTDDGTMDEGTDTMDDGDTMEGDG